MSLTELFGLDDGSAVVERPLRHCQSSGNRLLLDCLISSAYSKQKLRRKRPTVQKSVAANHTGRLAHLLVPLFW